mgnify:CR=1 FL=1
MGGGGGIDNTYFCCSVCVLGTLILIETRPTLTHILFVFAYVCVSIFKALPYDLTGILKLRVNVRKCVRESSQG